MITIDKMFEYDFGFDYSDDHRSVEQIAKRLRDIRSNEPDRTVKQPDQGFWHSLINEDIMNKV